jgi:hypothetical protein
MRTCVISQKVSLCTRPHKECASYCGDTMYTPAAASTESSDSLITRGDSALLWEKGISFFDILRRRKFEDKSTCFLSHALGALLLESDLGAAGCLLPLNSFKIPPESAV